MTSCGQARRYRWAPINRQSTDLSAAGQPNLLLDAVLALVDDVSKKQPVDAKRFYVTGLSMGGYATWAMLGRVPGRIAAAVPICGGGDPAQAVKFKDVPIHAFHGDADPVVPLRATQEMIHAVEAAGGKPTATYYPGVQHDSWTMAYNDPELLRWLFAQHQP